VDQNTGTIKLKAIFPNPELRLWPGAFVNVRLALRVDHGVTTVPTQAVQRGAQGSYVFLVNADRSVTRRNVTISHQDDALAVVSSGLSPGDIVVTDGASRLTDGAHVKKLVP
jgi:multidrug efflux system membrane fusion protein